MVIQEALHIGGSTMIFEKPAAVDAIFLEPENGVPKDAARGKEYLKRSADQVAHPLCILAHGSCTI